MHDHVFKNVKFSKEKPLKQDLNRSIHNKKKTKQIGPVSYATL